MKRQVALKHIHEDLEIDRKELRESLKALLAVGAIDGYYLGKDTLFIDTKYATLPLFRNYDLEPTDETQVSPSGAGPNEIMKSRKNRKSKST